MPEPRAHHPVQDPLRWVLLGAWILFVCWMVGAARLPRAHADDAAPRAAVSAWPPSVTECGLTVELAKAAAVRKAVALLEARLREHDPPLTAFKPSDDYVRRHLIDGPGAAAKGIQLVDALGESEGWTYRLLEPPSWATLRYLDHKAQLEQRSRERRVDALMIVAAGFIASLTAWSVMRFAFAARKAAGHVQPNQRV